MFKLGLIINPYAGIGGALGLKGSDGERIRQQALDAGATLTAASRMEQCLAQLQGCGQAVTVYTAAGKMGGDLCGQLGLPAELIYQPERHQTEARDTIACAKALLDCEVDLILFAGGDGTARNVYQVVANTIPVLGVPAGCKIHSGVYAVTPAAAGRVLLSLVKGDMLSLQTADVKDIDENAFRQGVVNAKAYGEMQTPANLAYIQATKMGGVEVEELVLTDIADHVIEMMDDAPNTLFVMGSGSTVAYIMAQLGLANTLLGVDLVQNRQLIGSDLNAQQLETQIANHACKIVISLIGGQGHILGRGNQQLSPTLIRQVGKHNLCVVATKSKLKALQGRPLISDSGDIELDKALCGRIAVITGYHDEVTYPIRSPGNDDDL